MATSRAWTWHGGFYGNLINPSTTSREPGRKATVPVVTAVFISIVLIVVKSTDLGAIYSNSGVLWLYSRLRIELHQTDSKEKSQNHKSIRENGSKSDMSNSSINLDHIICGPKRAGTWRTQYNPNSFTSLITICHGDTDAHIVAPIGNFGMPGLVIP